MLLVRNYELFMYKCLIFLIFMLLHKSILSRQFDGFGPFNYYMNW